MHRDALAYRPISTNCNKYAWCVRPCILLTSTQAPAPIRAHQVAAAPAHQEEPQGGQTGGQRQNGQDIKHRSSPAWHVYTAGSQHSRAGIFWYAGGSHVTTSLPVSCGITQGQLSKKISLESTVQHQCKSMRMTAATSPCRVTSQACARACKLASQV